MRVAIIGCGLIGRKRARGLDATSALVACCDVNNESVGKFSKEFSCRPFLNYRELFGSMPCEIVIVCVVNKYIRDIVVDALRMGKNVLVEKPLGRNAGEAGAMLAASAENHLVLKVGFNHRFHPAIWKAKEIVDDGGIGEVFNVRTCYGHGGRPGMEKEWRASKDLCGGGELLDQGVHVIDLIRWFGGEIEEVFGKVESKFWETEVEDNAFAILKTTRRVTASFHVSWTNWKNIFSFEIFGTAGYLRIEGLGGSYGPETLEFGRRRPEGGVPDVKLFQFSPEDVSWKMEWNEFLSAIKDNRQPIGTGVDGLRANEVVEAISQSSAWARAVRLRV